MNFHMDYGKSLPICNKFMEDNLMVGDYNALYEMMQTRVYNKLLSYKQQ